jgi:uncharacterized short protein YbdD (DUF466 family)
MIPVRRGLVTAVRRTPANVWWFLRELSGESAYDHYLTHHHHRHPTTRALTRREFEHLKTTPTIRCC